MRGHVCRNNESSDGPASAKGNKPLNKYEQSGLGYDDKEHGNNGPIGWRV